MVKSHQVLWTACLSVLSVLATAHAIEPPPLVPSNSQVKQWVPTAPPWLTRGTDENSDASMLFEHSPLPSWDETPPADKVEVKRINVSWPAGPSTLASFDGGCCTAPAACPSPSCCCPSASGSCGCDNCCSCGCNGGGFGGADYGRRGWLQFDTLMWFRKAQSTPPLLTRSPAGTPIAAMGIVESGSDVLYGGKIGDRLNSGGRVRAGMWLDPNQQLGVQQEFFALGSGSESASFGGNNEILARPFFNTSSAVNAPDAQVFNMPDVLGGTTTFRDESKVFSSATSILWNLGASGSYDQSQRTDLSLGYRFFRIDEEFEAREQFSPLSSRFVDATSYSLNDQIETRNTFHGVEFGATHARRSGPWGWDAGTSLAIGDLRRTATVDGSTSIVVPGLTSTTFPGGFYVGPEDIRRISDHDLSVIPQAQFNLSRAIAANWRLRAGYNFLYLGSAFRPNSFLDTSFDGARLANANGGVADEVSRPDGQGVWLHGVNVGLVGEF